MGTIFLPRATLGAKSKTLTPDSWTRITFGEDAGRIIHQPVIREFISGLRGSLNGKPSALAALLEERKRERSP
jgi:hypothetical protein